MTQASEAQANLNTSIAEETNALINAGITK